jgi:hypothetical protein
MSTETCMSWALLVHQYNGPRRLNNAVSVEQSWAPISCKPLGVRRAGAQRTQGAPDLVRAGVGSKWGVVPRMVPKASQGHVWARWVSQRPPGEP